MYNHNCWKEIWHIGIYTCETMSHVIALVALLLILCLFFPKEHINVCLKYLVECPNTCGVEIQREKVRCSVPDPDPQMEGGGGGGCRGVGLQAPV